MPNRTKSQRGAPRKQSRGRAASSSTPSITASAQRSQAAQLVHMVASETKAELFHSPDRRAFVAVRIGPASNTWPMRDQAFRRYLEGLFYKKTGRVTTGQAVEEAIRTLEANALYDGPEQPVAVRVGHDGGNIYLDLGDGHVVEICPGRWTVIASSPVRFWRPAGFLVLPIPEVGGHVDEARPFLDSKAMGEDDFLLQIAWLLGTLCPWGAYPLLGLSGPQGSGKSTRARVLRALIDPNTASLRAAPRSEHDLVIAAKRGHVIALDNLTYVPPWLSDALCRLLTGGGFATRELYTNDEETLIEVKRPVLLTGISVLPVRSDLLDRAILLDVPALADDQRQTEQTFWPAFEAVRARVLGALLTGAAGVLRELPQTVATGGPRLIDFARFVGAAEEAFGWKAGTFLAAYERNRHGGHLVALEATPLVEPLRNLLSHRSMTSVGPWEGTAHDLLNELSHHTTAATTRQPAWPKNSRWLAGRLRELAPNLAAVGIEVTFFQTVGCGSEKRIRITRQGTP